MINPSNILKIGVDFWASQVLLCAIELDIFTELSNGPLEINELQELFEINEDVVEDFFDSLVALGFLIKKDNEYTNSDDVDYYLDRNKDTYLGSVLGLKQYDMWGNLLKYLKGDYNYLNNQERGEFYKNLYKSKESTEEYAKSMSTLNLGDHIAIADKIDCSDYDTVVDLGCAEGGLLVQLMQKNKHIKGIGLDLPEIEEVCEKNIEKFSLHDRIKFLPLNFLTDDLPKADAYTLGHIIHALSIEDRFMLLKKVYDSLPEGGMIIIYEHIIDDERKQNAFSLLMSINMKLESGGVGSLTGRECCSLLKEVGFTDTQVIELVGPSYMITGKKL